MPNWMNNFVRVNGTGKADYGEYKPSEQTRSGRTTQRPQWLVQERCDGGDAIKRMTPEERMVLMKKTLKKSNKLTQKLLRKLDREWDEVFKEDDDDNVSVTSSIVSHGTDSEVELESLEKVLRRGTRGRAMLASTRRSRRFEETPEKTSSEDEEDEESDFENTTLGDRVKRKMRVEATGSSKRAKVNYREIGSDTDEEEAEETPEESSEEEEKEEKEEVVKPTKKREKPKPKRFMNKKAVSSDSENEPLQSKRSKQQAEFFFSKKERRESSRRNGKSRGQSNEGSSEDVPLHNKKKKRNNQMLERLTDNNERNGNTNKKLSKEEIVAALGSDNEEEEDGITQEEKEEIKKAIDNEKEKVQENGDMNGHTVKEEIKDSEAPNPKMNRQGRKWNDLPIPFEQPLLVSGGIMKPYQIEGMIWMANLRKVGANGILADEMGLGKTLQTISLFCHTYEVDKKAGPFLVIAPLSTLLNWKREVERFAPGVPVKLLYPAREAVEEWDHLEERHPSLLGNGKTMGTIYITSYETAVAIRSMLNDIEWSYIVVDEGHRLKNRNCRLGIELRKITSKHRLLLTGTPLQNDMEELWALLNFLQPDLFNNYELFADWFDARKLDKMKKEGATAIVVQEQKNNILAQIHRIIGPFILRRKKMEVDCDILPKKEVMVYCPFTHIQSNQYKGFIKTLKNAKKWGAQNTCLGGAMGPGFQMQYMQDLRNACNHPYIAMKHPGLDKEEQDIIDCCGKMQVLHQMLERLTSEGHKTLVFSQFTRILDLIGKSLKLKGYDFCQLDGRTKLIDRQIEVDRFFTEPETKVFLLSTRAGGLGINLIAADTCIIYDSDWNPQQDLQAQDRCHRIGQTRPVVIFRLITQNTIDENIVQRAQAKRAIEKLIVHQDKFKSGITSLKETTQKVLSPKEILKILLNEDDDVNTTEEASADQYGLDKETLDKLLDRSDIVKEWKEKKKEMKKLKKEEDSTKMKSDDTLDIGMAPIEEEDEGDVLESLFECLICQRPIMCKGSKLVKMCGRFSCKFQTERLRKGPKVVLDKTDIPRFLTPELFENKPKPQKSKNGKKGVGGKIRAPRAPRPYVPKPKFLGPKSRDPKKIAAAEKKKADASIYNNIITILSSDEEGEEEEEEEDESEEEEDQEVQSVQRPRQAPKARLNQASTQSNQKLKAMLNQGDQAPTKSKQKQKLTPVKKSKPSKQSKPSSFHVGWSEAEKHFDFKPPNGYQCKICKVTKVSKASALTHYRQDHLEAGYDFVCPICPYVTTTRTNLYGHLRGPKHKADYREKDLDEFMRKKGEGSNGKKANGSNGKKETSNGNVIKNVTKKSNDIYNVDIVSADEDEQFDGSVDESPVSGYEDSDDPIEIIMPRASTNKDVGKTAWDVGLESYQQRVNSLPHPEYEPASKVQKSPLSSDVEEIVPAEEITLDD